METDIIMKLNYIFDFVKVSHKIYNKIIIYWVINCSAIDVYGSLFENLMVKYTSCAKSIYIYIQEIMNTPIHIMKILVYVDI